MPTIPARTSLITLTATAFCRRRMHRVNRATRPVRRSASRPVWCAAIMAPQQLTAEQLLRLPDGDRRLELIEGELHEMPSAGAEHGTVALHIAALPCGRSASQARCSRRAGRQRSHARHPTLRRPSLWPLSVGTGNAMTQAHGGPSALEP
jgi:hypothetical protein